MRRPGLDTLSVLRVEYQGPAVQKSSCHRQVKGDFHQQGPPRVPRETVGGDALRKYVVFWTTGSTTSSGLIKYTVSGEAPQVPVASRKSGRCDDPCFARIEANDLGIVYEKRLIESYVSENGTEPTTGEDLTVEDLIDLRTSRIVRPRPPTLTSIPSLLGVFQEEWDALALEAYTLKQNLAQTRQELSTALYQHDAAVRVIARLTRERDEAREALSKISIGSRAAPTNGDAMQVDSTGLPDALVAKVEETKAK